MIAFIALGSNLGDREKNINEALRLLDDSAGVSVKEVAGVLETSPVGGPEQPDYFNTVCKVETELSIEDLLNQCHVIEKELGRTRKDEVRWGPRTIDLDILLAGDLIVDSPSLTLPHPRMHEREFVLVPLAEIASDVVHPVCKKTVGQLLEDLKG